MNHATPIESPSPSISPDAKNVLGQYIPLLYHYNMLQDADRVDAFRDAINLLVRPGMSVVELGGGTGILSSFASRRGARVTCVERNPELVDTSRQFLSHNGLADFVTVVQADAAQFVPDEPVDVVVCEMLHVGLLREKQADVIRQFKRNYRARFGEGCKLPIFIPEVTILMIQPVEQDFDFAGYTAPVPMFQPPLLTQDRTTELSPLHAYANIAYGDSIPTHFDMHTPVTLGQSGHINAVRLVTQNVLAIDESAKRAITWPNQCLVLPIPHAFFAEKDESVAIDVEYRAGDTIESFCQSLTVQLVD